MNDEKLTREELVLSTLLDAHKNQVESLEPLLTAYDMHKESINTQYFIKVIKRQRCVIGNMLREIDNYFPEFKNEPCNYPTKPPKEQQDDGYLCIRHNDCWDFEHTHKEECSVEHQCVEVCPYTYFLMGRKEYERMLNESTSKSQQ